jgi:DNA-directed RNA polymerase II subunit RPB7
LSHTIHLHPSHFGPQLRIFLKKKLLADVEGTCSGRYGYIITVVDVINIGTGKLMPSFGFAEFNVLYTAIVYKPFKGEVVDGKVTLVNKVNEMSI